MRILVTVPVEVAVEVDDNGLMSLAGVDVPLPGPSDAERFANAFVARWVTVQATR